MLLQINGPVGGELVGQRARIEVDGQTEFLLCDIQRHSHGGRTERASGKARSAHAVALRLIVQQLNRCAPETVVPVRIVVSPAVVDGQARCGGQPRGDGQVRSRLNLTWLSDVQPQGQTGQWINRRRFVASNDEP